ncbi:methyl-accepting chemotaxis protein [Mangrovicoccus sp. HB161399]|uniref:methyl-accepting chemotaxis protein n=1 Tax=Mangrovicoccus sp. HB161399 TaxID=2720392 RepID=UPI0015518341|nr:methyl-accepting chemotaxis protein [Mangrovicoccus sp. HB161399]
MTGTPAPDASSDDARGRGAIRQIAWGALGLAPLPLVSAIASGNTLPPILAGIGIFSAMALAAPRLAAANGQILASTALMGQIMVLTASLAGHPWQVDSHMAFFAALACLMVLNDFRPILAATLLIVVHHVSLAVLFPALIYPPADFLHNVERVLIHGAAAGIESAVLIYAVVVRKRMEAHRAADSDRIAAANEKTESSLREAEAALQSAETSSREAQEAQAAAQQAAEQAKSEMERAREADAAARAAEQRETERQAETNRAQQAVVDALKTALKELSERKLYSRIPDPLPEEYEELRLDFNSAAETLAGAMAEVLERAGSIGVQSNDISGATTDLAKRTETQASSLAEVSATVSQIARQVKDAAQLAQTASGEARETSSDAQASSALVGDAVAAMGKIEESSGKIHSIIDTIDEISFQTNLLALNAGVEAARAGEAGRGFAVVASEVRALAQRSSDAALEIKTLIENSTQLVQNGVGLVNRTGESLQSVRSRIEQISDRIREITESAMHQSTSLAEIDTTLGGLDRVTQQNAAMFEETTASNQELRGQTEALLKIINTFLLTQEDGAVPQRKGSAA